MRRSFFTVVNITIMQSFFFSFTNVFITTRYNIYYLWWISVSVKTIEAPVISIILFNPSLKVLTIKYLFRPLKLSLISYSILSNSIFIYPFWKFLNNYFIIYSLCYSFWWCYYISFSTDYIFIIIRCNFLNNSVEISCII